MRNICRFLFHLVFVLITLSFIGAILSTIISPKVFWPLAFMGLGYPIIFLLLGVYFFYWFFTRNKKMLYPAILLFIGLITLPGAFNLKPKPKPKSAKNTLKVMNYNVRNFEVYDKKKGRQNRDKIIALIKKESPDILCIQEAHNFKHFVLLDDVANEIGLPHYYFEIGVTARSGGQFGVATFSKYKIKSHESFSFGSGGNVGSKVDLIIGEEEVSVFNIHLESASIENSYYNYSSEEIEKISEQKIIQRSKRVLRQLRAAYVNRAEQARTIRKAIKKTKTPVIVCGDFNDTPVSYSYATIKRGLKDTFKKGKMGFGETYPEIPILRIDHILVSPKFKVLNYRIQKEKISDHYPVITELERKN